MAAEHVNLEVAGAALRTQKRQRSLPQKAESRTPMLITGSAVVFSAKLGTVIGGARGDGNCKISTRFEQANRIQLAARHPGREHERKRHSLGGAPAIVAGTTATLPLPPSPFTTTARHGFSALFLPHLLPLSFFPSYNIVNPQLAPSSLIHCLAGVSAHSFAEHCAFHSFATSATRYPPVVST